MTVVSDVEIRLRADIARLRQDMQEARRETREGFAAMSASANAFKGVLEGVFAGLSVGAFMSFIKMSIDATDALNDMSARTKVAIEDLAGLAYAAKLGDTSLDGVAASISKLGQNIGKESDKFRALGVTAKDPLEAFKQLADVFKNIQDPQQRAAFGAEALGKSWQEAAVLLDGGSKGIAELIDRGKELSGVTEQVAADAGAFNDKLDELTFAAQGAGTRIAAGLLPTLQKIADSFSADSVNGDKFAGTVTVLSAALKTLYSVGVGVSALFVGLGKSIGGTAAVAVAALSDGFTGALATYKAMAADVYTGLGDAAIQIGKVWADTGKSVASTADDTAKATGDSTAKVAAFLNAGEIQAARDRAAAAAEAAAEKEKKAYAGLIVSIREKMAADQLEIAGGVALTDGQKLRIKIDEELAAGKISLTKEHIKEIHALLDNADALEKNAAAAKQVRAAVAALADERDKNYQALVDEARANEDLVATYGKTKMQIAQMALARDQDRLSQRGALDLSEDTVAQLEREIEARKRNIAAMGSLDVLEKQKKASEEAADAQKAFWKSIDDTAHSTFVSILDGSKNTAQRLKDTFKNVFFDWLYQQTIKKWIINIGTETSAGSTASSIASLFGGGASSGGSGAGGMLGTASNWLSIGKTIYTGFTTGITSSLGGYISTLGSTFGSEAVAAFGAGMQGGALGSATASAASGYAGTTAAGSGATLGASSAIPIIGWIIAGMNAANGFRKEGFTPNNGTITNPFAKAIALPTNQTNKLLEKLGVGSALANILSGASINTKLFGRADPRVESQGLRGSIDTTGVNAETYAKILEKGGWFRSDKRYEKSLAVSGATDTGFDDTVKNIITAVKGFGAALGIEAAAIDGYTKSFDIKLTGDAAKDNEAVAKLFSDVGDELSLRLVPGLAAFAKEGETMSATLQRLAMDYQAVDSILSTTGQSIKLFGVAGIQVREDLIAAAGGLEQLSSGVSYFQQNFLTGAQQLAPLQKQVADALAAMGKSAVTTNEQFRDTVLGIDLGTKAGAELYAQMLALAPAFKTVADAAEQAAQESARAAEQLAAAKAAEELQRIADAARLLGSAVDSAMSGLERSVQAQKDSNQKVFDDLMKSIGTSIDTASSKVDQLKEIAGALAGGIATPSAVQGEMSRAAARAALSAAVQVAKSGGGLPGAADITTMLGALRSDSADNYGSMIEYQRAAAAANQDIASLAGVADTELTLAQKTLAALQDQRLAAQLAYDMESARLDGILAQGQAMVDRLNGIYGGVMAIPDALAALALSINAAMANSLASAGATTQGAYGQFLNRAASPEEVAYWRDQAAAGRDIASSVASSEEARIQSLYQKYLGRAGEGAGVDFYEAQLASGKSWQQIEAGFAGSAEAQGRNTPVATAIDTLNVQMASMQTSMNRTAAATTKLADQFDQVSGGGNALFTETA